VDSQTDDPVPDPAALLAEAEAELAAVDDALRRLDDGTYGRCRACGGTIADEVLASNPLAERCARCEDR